MTVINNFLLSNETNRSNDKLLFKHTIVEKIEQKWVTSESKCEHFDFTLVKLSTILPDKL